MDSSNWSTELDKLFCGFFSCCAAVLREDEAEHSSEQNYLVFSQKRLGFEPVFYVTSGNIQEQPGVSENLKLHRKQTNLHIT